jgi:hypothetical protein
MPLKMGICVPLKVSMARDEEALPVGFRQGF